MAANRSRRGKKIPQTPFNLLGLPVELQIRIFKFALQDPTLWDRRHQDGCNLRPTGEGVIEHPPWIWHRPIIGAVMPGHVKEKGSVSCSGEFPVTYNLVNTWTFCHCAKRSGINLLRTNRHVFSVAAPLFWSEARFCFFDGVELAACVAATSPRTRALIRDVSIVSTEIAHPRDMRVHIQHMGVTVNGFEDQYVNSHAASVVFRNSLRLLPALEHLAVPCEFLFSFGRMNQLGEYDTADAALMFPRLKILEFTQMRMLGGSSNLQLQMHSDRIAFWNALYRNKGWTSFVVYSQRFDVRGSAAAMSPESRPLYVWYGIVGKIYMDLLTVGPRMLGDDSLRLAPHADLVGGCKTMTVQLANNTKASLEVDVTFYSLPLDKDACAKSRLARSNVPVDGPRAVWNMTGSLWGQGATRRESIRQFEGLVEGQLRYPMKRCKQGPLLHLSGCPYAARERQQQQQQQQHGGKRKRVKKNRRGYKKAHDWQE